jgi:hypothetical protein
MNSVLDRRLPALLQSAPVVTTSPSITPAKISNSPPNDGYRYWTWGERFRPVPSPEEWSFPRTNVKAICDMFLFGIPVKEIRPLRKIVGMDLLRKDQQRFTRAEVVFKAICNFTVSLGHADSLQAIYQFSLTKWDQTFDKVYTPFLEEIRFKKRKVIKKTGDLSYITLYDYIKCDDYVDNVPDDVLENVADNNVV